MTLGFVLVVVAFIVVVVPPIAHEVNVLITNYPHYKANLIAARVGLGSDPQAPSHQLPGWEVQA